MSTQESSTFPTIPFTQTQPHQPFRLLELPPELLDLLSSDAPPTLYLKSSIPSTEAGTPRTKAAEYVHLCSPTQTYQVRQVSTSNSVYVVEPSLVLASKHDRDASGPDGETDAAVNGETDSPEALISTPSGALTAIGLVGSVLELQPVSYDVVAHLQRMVPGWKYGIGDAITIDTLLVKLKRRDVFDQIPAPDVHIEDAMRRLFIFESNGTVWRPDAQTLVKAWEDAMQKNTLNGHGALGIDDFKDLYPGLNEEEDEGAVLANVKDAIWQSPVLQDGNENEPLDPPRTTRWVGETILRASKIRTPVEDFLTSWRNLLPEKWGEGVSLDALDAATYDLDEADGAAGAGRTITWKDHDSPSAAVKGGLESASKDAHTAGSASAAPATKRKWHDKFKASRNVKR